MLRPESASPRGSGLAPLDYVLAIVLFSLALMSKSMLVTLPFVLLLLDYWPLQRFQSSKVHSRSSTPRRPSTSDFRIIGRLLREKIPFFVLAAAASVVTFLVQSRTGARVTGLPFLARLENALVSYCRYLIKLCWPVDLSVFYPHPGSWPLQTVLLSGVVLVGVSSLAFALRRRCPYFLLGWFWFLGTLVPVIGLVQVGVQSMADRYTYFPMIGILVLLVWGACDLTQRWRFQSIAVSMVGAATIYCCAVLTREQTTRWKDGETLFRHAIAVTANNCIAQNNLAVALEKKGLWEEAIVHYRGAIRLKPGYAEAHNGLGLVLEKKGRSEEAISQMQEALRLRPAFAQAHNSLGATLARKGRFDEAVRHLQEALRLRPGMAEAHFNLGVVLGTQGRLDEAIQQYQEALKLKPDDAEAHNFLGGALANKRRFDEAIRHFQDALRLRPGYAQALENLILAQQFKEAPASPQPAPPKP
jgi:protein O-mannosyl-transferase